MTTTDLKTYLQGSGMTVDAATAISDAYTNEANIPGGLADWLTANGWMADAVLLLIRDWEAKANAADGYGGIAQLELVTVRNRCVYEVAAPDQLAGRCYCVAAFPATFPGPMEATAADGNPPEKIAILAAEADHTTGRFRWVSLSPNAKLIFGTALARGRIAQGKWAWVREYDLMRGETPPGYGGL